MNNVPSAPGTSNLPAWRKEGAGENPALDFVLNGSHFKFQNLNLYVMDTLPIS